MKKQIIVSVNKQKEQAVKTAAELRRWLNKNNCQIIDADKTGNKVFADLAIVLGGDGMMLKAARMFAGADIPILGVSMGSLGFLSEVTKNELFNSLKKVLDGQYRLDERTMLQASVVRKGKKIGGKYIALNDCVIRNNANARVIRMKLLVNKNFVSEFNADGLIVSTPIGSTAYNLAAGGPVVHPQTNVTIITPICAHSLSLRPVVVSEDSEIEVILTSNHAKICLSLDGQKEVPLQIDDIIRIIKSQYKAKLIRLKKDNYFYVLQNKLGFGV